MPNTNAKVACKVASEVYYAEPYPHDEVSTVPKTAPIIESALATAQSNLAREVLAEVDSWRHAPAASNIGKRLEDLFTRLGMEIGAKTEGDENLLRAVLEEWVEPHEFERSIGMECAQVDSADCDQCALSARIRARLERKDNL